MRRIVVVMSFLLGCLIVAASAYASDTLNQVDIAHGSQGNQYMACYLNSSNDLKCRLVTATGSPTGAELAMTYNTCANPSIAYDSDEDAFLVVWAEQDGEDWSLKARRVTAACQFLGDEIILATGLDNDLAPKVVYSPYSQRYLVAYCITSSIQVQFIEGDDGGLDGPALEVIPGSYGGYLYAEAPGLAYDSVNNRYLVSGLAWGNSFYQYTLYGALVDDAYTPSVYTSPFVIYGPSTYLYPPTVAFDSTNERFLAVWEVYTGSGHELWGQLINTDGSLYGTNWKINADREVNFVNDVVYKAVDDRYLVAWLNYDGLVLPEIHAQEVDSDGGNYEDEFTLAAPAYQWNVALAYNAGDNNTVLAYATAHSNASYNFVVTPEVESADLYTAITGPDKAVVDESLTYMITATNYGDDNATGVSLTVDVPGGTSFVQASASRGSCDFDAPTLTCDLGYLENGDNASVTLEIIPTEVGSITVAAVVTSDVLDPYPLGNSDSKDTSVSRNLTLSEFEGTIGTEIEIVGLGFGEKKGKVTLLGSDKPVSLKVLSWNEEGSGVIRAQVKKAAPTGLYDMSVQPKEPKGAAAIIEQDAFEIMAPRIFVAPSPGFAGETRSMAVLFSGSKKGKVYIEYYKNDRLKKKNCKVVSWPLDSSEIQFVIPKGLPTGTRTLVVQNKIDEDSVLFEVTDEK